jgi:outer membrane immunogenic protein
MQKSIQPTQCRFAAFGINALKSAMVAATLVAAGVAQAQNTDWSGAYFGVNSGFGHGKFKVHTSTVYSPTGYFATTSPPAIDAAGVHKMGSTAFNGGLEGGYNLQFGHLVVGATATFELMNFRAAQSTTALYPHFEPTGFTIAQSVETNWQAALRPRIGITTGDFLFYATGGVALADIKYREQFTDTFANAAESAAISKHKTGWIAGFGAEYRLQQSHWSIKAEVLYADYGKITTTSTNFAAFGTTFPMNPYTHSVSFESEIVHFGLNFRF